MDFILLADDVLICTIAFLSVPDILRLRQCKRFDAVTRLPIIWTNAYKLNILSNDYLFLLDDIDLEQRTLHAYRLASRWLPDCSLDQVHPRVAAQMAADRIQGATVNPNDLGLVEAHKCSKWSHTGTALDSGM
ncbi:uncharacterized protein BT62DRAFT_1081379 [Guyanagaster necrorhizus]|uniref:Uncharacterized protein n=1 Tax=Guyanagaster necrorhizus TaxID=856835 RepID=A0A9P8AMD3_9AGAR|nr:uncharacterized protein BT62DRAFT_1081379 [Guyanagaster necrorhizus MCA 3950]KAG7439732.1 hypothetical protein BT62DRAFT_1081379 [Guyanagaster necrorhizus MCA 3950]